MSKPTAAAIRAAANIYHLFDGDVSHGLSITAIIDAEIRPLVDACAPFRRFFQQYDRFAVNGTRPGLADEFYAIDGGDDVPGGASLKISQLRALMAVLDRAEKGGGA